MADFKSVISSIFGGKPLLEQLSSAATSIIDKYHMSPEDKLLFQQEIDKVMEEKRQFVLQMYQNDAADTDSARKMNTAIQGDKPSWLAKNVSYIIAISILTVWGGFTTYLGLSMLKFIQADKVDYANIMAIYSTVTSLATMIIGYYFGSSHGSVEKQKLIEQLSKD